MTNRTFRLNKGVNTSEGLENFKNNFEQHNNYVKANKEQNKEVNEDAYRIGAQKNRELTKRMEELSINGGFSTGNLARNNILRSSVSYVEGSLPTVGAVEMEYSEDKENDEISKGQAQYCSGPNVGKEIAKKIKEQKNTKKRNI